MQVIDPHIHLWDTRAVRYPWLENPTEVYSGDNRLLPQQYRVHDLLTEAGEIEVLKSVAVEGNPADPVAEAAWLQACADDTANHGHPHGIVAYVDLSSPTAPATLEALSAYRNVRGIRQILNVHANPRYDYVGRDFMRESLWQQNLRRLQRYRWSFDLQLYPHQIPEALTTLDANPHTLFVINHTGMFVDRSSTEGWRQWRAGLRLLAARPQTAIKISGLTMFDHDWSLESLRPYVLEAIEAFGAGRCLFASNFPIDRLHASYAALWVAYAEIVKGSSEAERTMLLRENARRCYRL